MIEVIGVRFKKAGKLYYFDPGTEKVLLDSYVIVETVRGVELGRVDIVNKKVDEEDVVLPLKKVMRVATAEDMQAFEENNELADRKSTRLNSSHVSISY